jgi:hypothetical protein
MTPSDIRAGGGYCDRGLSARVERGLMTPSDIGPMGGCYNRGK